MDHSYARGIFRKLRWALIAMLIALFVGAMVGYGIGGGNPLMVFWPGTWLHIADFLK